LVKKIFHVTIDATFLGVLAAGAWLLLPAAGLIVAGLAGLVLHYAVSTGSYDEAE
jgi:hypothetical protein